MIKRVWLSLASLFLAPMAFAVNNDVDLGDGGGDGLLKPFADFLQQIVDFAGGPGVLFISFLSFAFAIGLWVAAPKQGSAAMAWAFRVAIGVIALMNIALFLTWMQGL